MTSGLVLGWRDPEDDSAKSHIASSGHDSGCYEKEDRLDDEDVLLV